MEIIVLCLAFGFDLTVGDPLYVFHPVRLIGVWANYLDKKIFKNLRGVISGILFWFLVLFPFVSVYLIFSHILLLLSAQVIFILWESYILYSCFAIYDMISHVLPICHALRKKDIERAREKLRYIVGRDVRRLSKKEIIMASSESLAESFVDGFYSSILWWFAGYFIGNNLGYNSLITGGLFVLLYRASNTLDSTVGYRYERYEKFGKFSARMDDFMNFIPARLSPLALIPGVFFAGGNTKSALKCFFLDRMKSKSPNAAHPMSIFAGALNVTLGGPAYYEGVKIEKPRIGINNHIPTLNSLQIAIEIFIYSGLCVFIASILVLIFFL